MILRGSGDPSLTDKDLEEFVSALKNEGKINGDVYYDDGIFSGEQFGPNWKPEWKDLYFAVPITGLQINDNLFHVIGLKNEKTNKFEIKTIPLKNSGLIIDKRIFYKDPYSVTKPITATMNDVGNVIMEGDSMVEMPFATSATIRDPSKFAAAIFLEKLGEAGLINKNAKVIHFAGDEYGSLIYEHGSLPLSDLVTRMLKYSKNNYAETLVRTLGSEIEKEGSQEKGVKVLKEFLGEIGLPTNEINPFDGSGLSPETRVTGNSIIMLFDYVDTQDWKDVFWNALPQSQMDGTLKNRFKDIVISSPIAGKTGTHEFSSSLSGKIFKKEKNILYSVHIFNHPYSTEESVTKIIPAIDNIVSLIDKEF